MRTKLIWLVVAYLVCSPVIGDDDHYRYPGDDEDRYHSRQIGGMPLADFGTNELVIPCVEVKNLSPELDGKFFDVILDRWGNSMNFELRFARVEDPALCRAVADFAKFHDAKFDDLKGTANLLVTCERKQNRSKISVEVKNLAPGRYQAEVVSGGNIARSPLRDSVWDEVEFKFDSDPHEIAERATAIAADFIQGKVAVQILNQAGSTVMAVDSVSCLNR